MKILVKTLIRDDLGSCFFEPFDIPGVILMNVRDEHVLYGLRRHRFDLSNKIVIKLFAKVLTVDHNHARVRNANSRIPTGPRNHVALRSKESSIIPGSDRALMFNGKPSVTIPQGAQIMSDPVDLEVPQLGDLAISVYIPGDSGQLTMHATGLHTSYIVKGNMVAEPALNEVTTTRSWYWISAVDVMASTDAAAIVAFGDSITDGATSTNDADKSYPSQLAARILATPGSPKLAVVNQGISGNRLLVDGAGVNALARFDRDVIGLAGVKWLMILEGINDIGQTTSTRGNGPPPSPVTAEDLIVPIKQMIDRAHTHGIKVIGCTLTPYEGAGYYSEKGEEVRQAMNRWIRTSGAFDAVVDFDKATQDTTNAKTFKAPYNNTDHLHPNDAGYKAMADEVDLGIFTRKKAKK